MKEAALKYARRGFAVFPLSPRSKAPLKATRGFKDASWLTADIVAWWDALPRANVGIATGDPSGIWVLDVDPQHGGDVSLRALEQAHGSLVAPTVRTASGGCHLYFRLTEPVGCSRGGLPGGIDVRGTGGYVVAPPSTITEGSYRWDKDTPRELAPAPDWLLALIRKPEPTPVPRVDPARLNERRRESYLRSAIDRAAADLAATPAGGGPRGGRNNALNAAALGLARLASLGLDRAEAESKLVAAALAAGLPETEAHTAFKSGWNAGLRKPPRGIPQREHRRMR